MNKGKKILSLLLAMVMVFGAFAPAVYAAEEEKITKTVTLHKLLLDNDTMNAWDSDKIQQGTEENPGYDGTQTLEQLNAIRAALQIGNEVKEIPNVFFALQDKDGKYIKAEMEEDTLTPAKPIENTSKASEAGGLTSATGLKIDTSKLPQTEPTVYKIVEVRELSTYTGEKGDKTLSAMKAVPVEITLPLVNQNGIQENVHVYPKNTEIEKPENKKELDKDAEGIPSTVLNGQTVTIGDKVPYVVTSTIPAGSTYNKLAWSDKLSKGLKLNKDVTLTAKYTETGEQTLTFNNPQDYTLTYSPDENPDGFTLVLTDAGLKELAKITAPTDAKFKVKGEGEEINGKNLAVTFTLKYSAEVLESAVISNPLENTNTLHFGNNPGYTPEPGDNNPPPVTPKNGSITVDKKFTNGPLANSGDAEWPEGLEIRLELQVYNPENNSWTKVDSSEKTLTKNTNTATWNGLDNKKQYKVVELETKGWVPNYSSTEDGKVVIVNKKNDNPPPVTPDPVIVRTGGKKFVKTNLDGKVRLAGAEFVVSRTVDTKTEYLALKDANQLGSESAGYQAAEIKYQKAVADYNKELADTTKVNENLEVTDGQKVRTITVDNIQVVGKAAIEAKIAELKTARDQAYDAMNMQWKWVDSQDSAFKFITNQDGQWEVKGLAYGKYNYIEIKSPEGYANQKDPKEFTVSATSYTTGGNINYVSGEPLDEGITTGDATQITNKKISIPQTGGIGTVIFTVGGLALMGGATFALKRNKDEEEE